MKTTREIVFYLMSYANYLDFKLKNHNLEKHLTRNFLICSLEKLSSFVHDRDKGNRLLQKCKWWSRLSSTQLERILLRFTRCFDSIHYDIVHKVNNFEKRQLRMHNNRRLLPSTMIGRSFYLRQIITSKINVFEQQRSKSNFHSKELKFHKTILNAIGKTDNPIINDNVLSDVCWWVHIRDDGLYDILDVVENFSKRLPNF